MNRWTRGTLALALGFGVTVLAIEIERLTSDDSEPAGTTLGVLDPDTYCRVAHGDRARAVDSGVRSTGLQCWVLLDGLLTTYPIDADRGCALLYGEPAYASDPGIAPSWSCRRGRAPES